MRHSAIRWPPAAPRGPAQTLSLQPPPRRRRMHMSIGYRSCQPSMPGLKPRAYTHHYHPPPTTYYLLPTTYYLPRHVCRMRPYDQGASTLAISGSNAGDTTEMKFIADIPAIRTPV